MPLSRQSLSWMSTLEPSRCFHPARCAAIDPNEWLDWRFLPRDSARSLPDAGTRVWEGSAGRVSPGPVTVRISRALAVPTSADPETRVWEGSAGRESPGPVTVRISRALAVPTSADPETRVWEDSAGRESPGSVTVRISRALAVPTSADPETRVWEDSAGRVSPRPENSISVMSVGTEGRTASAPSLAPGGRRHRTMRLTSIHRPGWMVAGRNQRPVDLILAGNWACAFRRLPVLRLVRGSWFGIGFGWPLGAVEMR